MPKIAALTMLLPIIISWFVFVPCEVKSDASLGSVWKDMNNEVIQVNEHCQNKTCIVKCCPEGHHLVPAPTDRSKSVCTVADTTASDIKQMSVYKLNGSSGNPVKTDKTLSNPEFVFIQNDRFWNTKDKLITFYWLNICILEDGSLYSNVESKLPLNYCLDYYDKNGTMKLAYKIIIVKNQNNVYKEYFTAAGLLTSCVFMSLVLAVYGAVSKLRNRAGFIVMAYLLTHTLSFVLRAAQLLAMRASQPLTIQQCRALSPALYYFTIASFFWLNVISFDWWRITRSPSKSLGFHKHGNRKFIWYGLYAWGTPALLTLGEVTVDRLHLFKDKNKYKIPFGSCFGDKIATLVHLQVPIGIMTIANSVMFLMTAYSMWRIKRGVTSLRDSSKTNNSNHGYTIHLKMSILMGVSWILEMIPKQSLVLHIILDAYNVFLGIPIFIVFVCKPSVIRPLCKRLKIKNDLVEKLQASRSSKTTALEKITQSGKNDNNVESINL